MRAGDRARVPVPSTPAPGPLDVALSLILHRAHPFAGTERHRLLRARLGWGPDAPLSQKATATAFALSHQRVAQLERWVRDLLAATGPPPSVVRAMELLAAMAPCGGAEAALALYMERLTREVVHPGGVLVAARAAGLAVRLELIRYDDLRTAVVPIRAG